MRPRPRRVYADTSVFGGYFDQEFAKATILFVEQVRRGQFVLVVSPLVEDELIGAPDSVRSLKQDLLPWIEPTPVSDAARDLAAAYIASGVVTANWRDDALHVALAVVARADVIASWNFRHIVHLDKIRLYNAVNTLRGFGEIAIHSPAEVLQYEQDI